MQISLIATTNILREAANYIHRSSSWSQLAIILFGLLGICLFCLGLKCCDSLRQRHLANQKGSKALFLELCKLHHLSWSQRNLLSQVASESHLDEMARVFVDPKILGKKAADDQADSEPYQHLYSQLFGERSAFGERAGGQLERTELETREPVAPNS